MMKKIIEEKKILREKMLKKRRGLDRDFVTNSSKVIIDKLIKREEFKKATCISCYVNFEKEIETKDFINYSLSLGKTILVPIIIDKNIFLSKIESLDDLEPRTLGILEPMEERINLTDPKLVDLYILTGLAFDKNLNRLGFGAGYNDKAIKMLKPNTPKIALSYDFQVLDSIPIMDYDEKVDLIIGEKKEVSPK